MEAVVIRPSALVRQNGLRLLKCLCVSVLLIPFFGSDVFADRESNAISVDFQGFRWVASADAELSVESYRGHKAVKIQTPRINSSAKIPGLEFSEGRLEFELAPTGRVPPWICFHSKRRNKPNQLMVNPWPKARVPSSTSRLYQAVLTRAESNSLVINYRQGDDKFDPTRWMHVAIVSNERLCRIYIDRDEIPAIVVDSFFNASVIGIHGSCFIRNVTVTGDSS